MEYKRFILLATFLIILLSSTESLRKKKKQKISQFVDPPSETTVKGKKLKKPNIVNIVFDSKPIKPKKQSEEQMKEQVLRKLKNARTADDVFKLFKFDKKIKVKKVKVTKNEHKKPSESVGYKFFDASNDALQIPVAGSSDQKSNAMSAISFETFECQPRPAIVRIPTVQDGFFWPVCVKQQKCSGCDLTLVRECAPVKVENRSTTVMKIPYDGSEVKFHQHFILHHTKCQLACRVQASDCLPKQTYDDLNCECKCTQTPTLCPTAKQWSDAACDCVCSVKNTVCPKRHVWNTDRCMCVCEGTPCPANHIRDPSTCICINLG